MSDNPAIYDPTESELRVATEWHGGQSSMLYAISSTGALSRGTIRSGRDDAEWSYDLASQLWSELRDILATAGRAGENEDYAVISAWIDKLDLVLTALGSLTDGSW